MSERELEDLVNEAKQWPVTENDKEEQRRSFAYGNTHFENERITRDTINEAAESLKRVDEKD